MGDVSIPKPEPSKVGAKVSDLIESGHEFYATAVTGTPHGRTRRPVLFVIAMVGCVVGTQVWGAAVVGVIAMTLLAVTDQVVEL